MATWKGIYHGEDAHKQTDASLQATIQQFQDLLQPVGAASTHSQICPEFLKI